MSRQFSWPELHAHNRRDDLFIVLGGKVYDVTKFQDQHPGGAEFLRDQGGADVTELFEDAGHSEDARSLLPDLCIGFIKEDNTAKDRTGQHPLQNFGKTSNPLLAMLALTAMVFVSLAFYWVSLHIMKRADGIVQTHR